MVERLQADTTISLVQHEQTVAGALAEAIKEGAAPQAAAPAANADPFLTKLMTAAIGGEILSAFMMVREELTVSKPPAPVTPKQSAFIGRTAKAAHKSVPLMPQGYGEKKHAARQASRDAHTGLAERSRIAGMSLTGASMTGSAPSPIRGIKTNSKLPPVTELKKELATIKKTEQNPYEKGTNRLTEDLKKGNDSAERFVEQKPEIALSLARN